LILSATFTEKPMLWLVLVLLGHKSDIFV
jgi:hypothetical protein